MSLIKTWLHEKMTEEIIGTHDTKDLTVRDYDDFVDTLYFEGRINDEDAELLRYVMFG